MNFIDVIIILLLLIVVGTIFYFSFKNRKKGYCRGCPFCKECNKNKCLKDK